MSSCLTPSSLLRLPLNWRWTSKVKLQHFSGVAELENRKLEIEARLDAAKYALQRLSSFVSVRGTEFQCPRCWILNEAIASLRPIDGETKDQDSFRCIVCESEFGLRS